MSLYLNVLIIHAAKNEPYGVSVQEAIAFGHTVITSDKVGSSVDLIRHGLNGFIYSFNDIKALKNNIENSFLIDLCQKEKTNLDILKKWGTSPSGRKLKQA